MQTKKGSTARYLEKDYRKRADSERFRNMGSSSIGCGGQNSLEAENLRPNSPLGEWINDDDDDDDDDDCSIKSSLCFTFCRMFYVYKSDVNLSGSFRDLTTSKTALTRLKIVLRVDLNF